MDSILRPWSQKSSLYGTPLRKELLVHRPTVFGYKTVRVCKDVIYSDIAGACAKNMISGNYLGLAAAHIPEIYTVLCPFITKRFDTCQLGRQDYHSVQEYIPLVQEAYRGSWNGHFAAHYMDMLDFMKQTPVKYQIIDFDSMKQLNTKIIYNLVRGIANCGSKKLVLAVWHTSNREKGGGNSRIRRKYRPMLQRDIERVARYKILQWSHYDYYETQPDQKHAFPMRVEVARLWKKESKTA